MNHTQNKKQIQNKDRIRKLVMLSLFTAITYLSVYMSFKVEFLTFDIKNVFITIAAMIYGPVAGTAVSLAASLIEMIFYSTTGFYGFVMNFISSASFAIIASFIYRRKRTPMASYLSLGSATLGSTALMLVANLFITPFYMGVSMSVVAGLIPTLLFPFNLLKCLVSSALVLALYKPFSVILRRAGMIEKEKREEKYLTRRTVFTLLIALVIMAVSLAVFFLVLGGMISFGHT